MNNLDRFELVVAFAAILFMEIVHLFQRGRDLPEWTNGLHAWLRWPFYAVLTLSVTCLSVVSEEPFIYFQF